MFERYTEKARRAIFFARDAANEHHSREIDTEFLLLGILREDSEISLRWLNVSAEKLRVEILSHIVQAKTTPTNPHIKLSRESKRALAYAAEETERLGHRHIGVEHLFLGILREKGSSAEELLRLHGAELSKLREAVARENGQIPASPRPKRQTFSFLNTIRRKSEKIEEP